MPHIDILREPTKVAVQLSFIIDTSKVAVSDLSTDNLGISILISFIHPQSINF